MSDDWIGFAHSFHGSIYERFFLILPAAGRVLTVFCVCNFALYQFIRLKLTRNQNTFSGNLDTLVCGGIVSNQCIADFFVVFNGNGDSYPTGFLGTPILLRIGGTAFFPIGATPLVTTYYSTEPNLGTLSVVGIYDCPKLNYIINLVISTLTTVLKIILILSNHSDINKVDAWLLSD